MLKKKSGRYSRVRSTSGYSRARSTVGQELNLEKKENPFYTR